MMLLRNALALALLCGASRSPAALVETPAGPPSQPAKPSSSEVRGANPAELNDRADLILKVIDLPQGTSAALVAKYDMKLSNKVGANVEVPFLTRISLPGLKKTGLGDTLARVRFTQPLSQRFIAIAAVEIVLPAAGKDELGAGKWQMNPVVGVVHVWSPRSFSAVIVKRFQSIAGKDDRADIRTNQLRALHTFVLDHGWYVGGDVKFDFETVGRNEQWLTPEIELGKQINARWASSLRLGRSIGDRKNGGTLEFNVRTFF